MRALKGFDERWKDADTVAASQYVHFAPVEERVGKGDVVLDHSDEDELAAVSD